MRPRIKPGDVWLLDMGLAAKVRPALVLTPEPLDTEHALVTVVSHTTAMHPLNPWNVAVAKSWLKDGCFNVQQVGTFPTAKLMHRLGVLAEEEFSMVKAKLAQRLGISTGALARTAP